MEDPIPASAGMGLKPRHYHDVLEGESHGLWFEVHPENYMDEGGPPHRYLEAIRNDHALSLHSVGGSLGSDDRRRSPHLSRLKALVERYQPELVSDHLSWSGSGEGFVHDLLPAPLTRESLQRFTENIDCLQEALGRTILIENPSVYLMAAGEAIPELEFIAALCRRTGCGWLLDINNIFVSATNLGFNPAAYRRAVDHHLVKEIHLAGHGRENCPDGDLLIDDHGSHVPEPVCDLFMAGCYRPIRDYAVIGDCHGSALVSRDGSIDWCCLERLDADPICCRVLDSEKGGFLSVRPAEPFTASRAYVDGTNILQTTFTTASGVVTITDLMPVGRRPGAGTHDYVRLNVPGWLVRIIEGKEGHVTLDVGYRPSVAFARRPPRLVDEPGVVRVENRRDEAAPIHEGPCLYHDVTELRQSADVARASLQIQAGENRVLVLTPRPTNLNPLDPAERLRTVTEAFWREWIGYCRYRGPYTQAVNRSVLALKLLTYAPPGRRS